MLNQVKLTGRVKYVTNKDGKRVSQEREGKNGKFWSHLLTVITEQNGQGVNFVTVSHLSNLEDPINDGQNYDVSGYVRSWAGDKSKNLNSGQNIEAKRLTPVSNEEIQRRKEQVNDILSGSVTF